MTMNVQIVQMESTKEPIAFKLQFFKKFLKTAKNNDNASCIIVIFCGHQV